VEPEINLEMMGQVQNSHIQLNLFKMFLD